MLNNIGFEGGSIHSHIHRKYMVDFVVPGFHGDLLVYQPGFCITQDLHDANVLIILQISDQ